MLIFIISINIALFLTREPAQPEKRHAEVKSLLQKARLLRAGGGFTKEELTELLQRNKTLGLIVSFFSFAIFFVIALGLFLDFIIFILKREGGILIFPTILHRKSPRWGIWDVCKVGILFLWFGYMSVFIESFLSKIFPILKDDNLRSLLNATIADFLAFLFIIYFVIYVHKEDLISLGLSAKNFLKNLFYGIAGYFATVPFLISLLIIIVWFTNVFKYEPPIQPVLEIFLEEKKMGIITYLTIFVSLFGPIAEEMFFRAFMYRAIKARFGFRLALISSSALFALLHANLFGFLPILILGMLLAYLFEKTGTIVAPCAVHILHNSVMVALVFIMKAILQ